MRHVESLNALGEVWASFMGRALVDSSVLLIIVALIWLLLRRRLSAQFAHGLFLLVLLKLAVPLPTSWPSWSADGPIWRVASGLTTWSVAVEPIRQSPTPGGDDPVLVASIPEPIVAAAAAPATEPSPRMEASRPAPSPAPEVPNSLAISAWLMLAWAAISATLLARLLRSVATTRRLLREALTVPDGSGWFPVDFEALRRTAGVRSTVRWTISPKVTSPAVGGLLHPTVVMPPDLDDGLTPEQLNWVLLHELAHIRRGDLWVSIVQRILGAFFFFHPVVHAVNWIIDQFREFACDDAALVTGHASRRACGEGFLAIVSRAIKQPASPSPALGLFESRLLIRRRLTRILDGQRQVHERLSAPATVVLVGMALLILPYGHRKAAVAAVGTAELAIRPMIDRPADEPRSFALGATFLHDDRASTAGRPRSPVLAVAYSPDGGSLATAGEDSTVVLRDPVTGAARTRLEGHADAVTCLAFSPDGRTLASAGYDKTVRLWDAANGRPLASLDGHESWIFTLAFAPDGRTLASAGSDRIVRIWDLTTARASAMLVGSASAIRALAFSPDGQTLASAGVDREVTLWDMTSSSPRTSLRGHRKTIRALAFAPDGRTVASAGEDGEVRLWDAKSGRERVTLTGHADSVLSLSYSPSGATLASGGLDSAIKLWDTKSGRERATLVAATDGVPALAFAAGARRLASTGYDGTVRFWDAVAPSLSAAATLNHRGEARAVAFTPDGRTLYAAGSTDALSAYDPAGGLPLGPGLPGEAACLAVDPDGRMIALGGLDGKVRLVEHGSRVESAVWAAHPIGEVRALAFGRGVLASGGVDGKVCLWDVASRRRKVELVNLGGPIAALRFSPDLRTLAVAAGGGSGAVALFDGNSGERRGTLDGRGSNVVGLSYSPDGRTLATLSDAGEIALFDASTHAARRTWSHPVAGRAIDFSPDGRLLATSHADGDIVLWDAASGSKLATLRGHAGPVGGLAFAPNGRVIASAGRDRTVRLWDLNARKVAPRTSLTAGLACVGPVVASPDGRTLAVAEIAPDSDGQIVLWDLDSRQSRATLRGHGRGVISLAFSADGTTLASSGYDLSIRLWDAKTGAARGEFAATESPVRLAFTPDGRTLVSGGEDRILIFRDVEDGAELARVEGFRGPIWALAISPDGRRIATGGGRDGRQGGFGEVKVFDVASRAMVADLVGHSASVRSLAFSGDGSTLASGGVDSTVRLWDVVSGQPRLRLGGFPNCVQALGFSSDGRVLAAAGRADGVVSLLDAATGGEVARLVGHGGPVLGLAFTPNGRELATGGLDSSIKIWDVPISRAGIARH